MPFQSNAVEDSGLRGGLLCLVCRCISRCWRVAERDHFSRLSFHPSFCTSLCHWSTPTLLLRWCRSLAPRRRLFCRDRRCDGSTLQIRFKGRRSPRQCPGPPRRDLSLCRFCLWRIDQFSSRCLGPICFVDG